MCALVVLLFNKKTAPATVKVTSAVWLSNIYYGTFILICIKCGDIYYSFVTTFLKLKSFLFNQINSDFQNHLLLVVLCQAANLYLFVTLEEDWKSTELNPPNSL